MQVLSANAVVCDLCSGSCESVLDELVRALAAAGKIKDEAHDRILQDILRHESVYGGSGIGLGVATPHTFGTQVSDVLVGIGRCRSGIVWDTLDGKPVKLVILVLSPSGADTTFRIFFMAKISKLLRNDRFRDALHSMRKECVLGALINGVKERRNRRKGELRVSARRQG